MSKQQFQSAIDRLQSELNNLRAGRANPAVLENVKVTAYESEMSLQEVATVTVPEPQTLAIQPWDKGLIKAIETALRDSELNLSPVVDGEIIRINFPPLTEDKRKEMVKIMNEKIEEARIAIRKIREDLIKNLKEQEKAGDISEDDYFREEKNVQQIVDDFNNKTKDIAEKKENELMTV